MDSAHSKRKSKSTPDRNVSCCVCGGLQKDQSSKFRTCSGCKEKLGVRRYYCSRACQKDDWKTHREWCGSKDFWEYPHHPLLASEANFARPPALSCQLALIDSSPDILYNIAPGTDDAFRYTITDDKMLSVSFRRARDKAFSTRDLESIVLLGEALVAAVEAAASETPLDLRVENVYRQLREEYDAPGVKDVIVALRRGDGEGLMLERVHQDNMTNHPSDFWRAMARPMD
ncbi:MYND-type domain-containing protein [Favolaschia claudopus]|uniref:MYND-type domain-containing protein n=1 Tax=Favolaschia claudopus TaxID=2862362 RepID=A0AAW0B0M6_9AGAR